MPEQSESQFLSAYASSEIPRHLERISQFPYVELGDLMHAAFYTGGETRLMDVDVSHIVAGLNMPSWGAIARYGVEDVSKLIELIYTGKYDMRREPVELLDWGGAYGVLRDGNKRSGIAKIMGLTTIAANVVTDVQLDGLSVFSQEDYRVLLERREQGLWSGDFTVQSGSSSWSSFYAQGDVVDYEGVWVFSKDMVKVKDIYQSLGASGKLR
jgi:hypothetical protein